MWIMIIALLLLFVYFMTYNTEYFNIYYDQHDDKSFRPDSTLLTKYSEVKYTDRVFEQEFIYPYWFWNSSKLWQSSIPNTHNMWTTRDKTGSMLWDTGIPNARKYEDYKLNSDFWSLKYGKRYWVHFYGGYFMDDIDIIHKH
jgi:hypothetical protein